MHWLIKTLFIGLLLAAACTVAALAGGWRWSRQTARMNAQIGPGPQPPRSVFTYDQLAGLPPPVARYFRTVLAEGQPMIYRARIVQEGLFRTKPAAEPVPFVATQTFGAIQPAFVWDARIRMAPLVDVRVRDSYRAGKGGMKAAVLALLPVVADYDAPALNAGALQRYLAEAVWFPTALLPGNGVTWTPIDDDRALATITEGALSTSLEFRFNDSGEVAAVYAPARSRDVDGQYIPTPWRGRFSDYADRNGVRIPIKGEVAWLLDEGDYTYWMGTLTSVAFDFASPG